MDQAPLRDEIIRTYDAMSAQLQAAARFILDRPREVALLSMREQARQAGVQPATMTRLAKYLGLEGYEDIRERYAAAIRDGDVSFADKARNQVASQTLRGDRAVAAQMLQSISQQIERLAAPKSLEQIIDAANVLASARRIYCLGLRSSHSVAWHFHYIMTLIGERSFYLDGIASTGTDPLIHATDEDVLFISSVLPYARHAVELAEYAAGMGMAVVAVTDSEVSPVAQIARCRILVPTDTLSFFHSISPGFAIAEVLSAILAGRGGEGALSALRRTDRHLETLKTYQNNGKPRRG